MLGPELLRVKVSKFVKGSSEGVLWVAVHLLDKVVVGDEFGKSGTLLSRREVLFVMLIHPRGENGVHFNGMHWAGCGSFGS